MNQNFSGADDVPLEAAQAAFHAAQRAAAAATASGATATRDGAGRGAAGSQRPERRGAGNGRGRLVRDDGVLDAAEPTVRVGHTRMQWLCA